MSPEFKSLYTCSSFWYRFEKKRLLFNKKETQLCTILFPTWVILEQLKNKKSKILQSVKTAWGFMQAGACYLVLQQSRFFADVKMQITTQLSGPDSRPMWKPGTQMKSEKNKEHWNVILSAQNGPQESELSSQRSVSHTKLCWGVERWKSAFLHCMHKCGSLSNMTAMNTSSTYPTPFQLLNPCLFVILTFETWEGRPRLCKSPLVLRFWLLVFRTRQIDMQVRFQFSSQAVSASKLSRQREDWLWEAGSSHEDICPQSCWAPKSAVQQATTKSGWGGWCFPARDRTFAKNKSLTAQQDGEPG